jgi:hypothetical protein
VGVVVAAGSARGVVGVDVGGKGVAVGVDVESGLGVPPPEHAGRSRDTVASIEKRIHLLLLFIWASLSG